MSTVTKVEFECDWCGRKQTPPLTGWQMLAPLDIEGADQVHLCSPAHVIGHIESVARARREAS